jgi:hypothetical protein
MRSISALASCNKSTSPGLPSVLREAEAVVVVVAAVVTVELSIILGGIADRKDFPHKIYLEAQLAMCQSKKRRI